MPLMQAAPNPQACPHMPQFEASVAGFVQKPVQVPPVCTEQTSIPAGHGHDPPMHVSPVGQQVPQRPQFCGSRATSTHAPGAGPHGS